MLSLDEMLHRCVALEIESVDRVYLNAYVPRLQSSGGVYTWLRDIRRLPIPSPAMLGKIGTAFVRDVRRFAQEHHVALEPFPKGVRKEDHVRPYVEQALAHRRTGVVFIGSAQERAHSYRGVRAAGPAVSFDFQRAQVAVTWFYFYIVDPDCGPCFIKLCTYAPFTGRFYVNGHEWVVTLRSSTPGVEWARVHARRCCRSGRSCRCVRRGCWSPVSWDLHHHPLQE